ncbi:MAG TPA: hypothetical protein VH761_08445 [Ilumatobacteraceae bacterium]|jgi:hypothetical protein
MTVDPAAQIAGGVLAARFGLPDDVVAADVTDNLIGDFGVCSPATLWVSTMLDSPEEVDSYRAGARQPAASWMQPDEQIVAHNEVVLHEQWDAAVQARLTDRNTIVDPVLRLIVNSVEDALALQQLGTVGPMHVTAHIGANLGPWQWRWPLRVGVVSSAHGERLAAEVKGPGRFADQYEVSIVEAGADTELDILVVHTDAAERPAASAGAVLIVGPALAAHDAAALTDRLDRGRGLRCGAVVAVPDDDMRWFEELVRELSHDRPLDAAVGIVRPDAVTAGDPRFLAVTALRNWSFLVTEQLRDRQIDAPFADIARTVRFDSEAFGGRITADNVRTVEAAGAGTVSIRGDALHMAAAKPPAAEAAAEAPILAPTAPPAEAATADSRRLNVVVESGRVVRHDGFVGGRTNSLRLNIAAHVDEPVVSADRTFNNPTPGQAIDLDVLIQAGWAKAKPAKRTLHLPADADSEWTEPVKLRVPATLKRAEVFITVMFQGRAVQSAVLSGAVLDKKAPVGPEAMTLTVDVSTPPSVAADTARERPEAGASFVVLPLNGKPALFDAARGVPISAGDLDRANRNVRKDLIETFLDPPADLAAAAHPLAKLATRGSLLRDALRGKEKTFYDDVTWVHVSSFGGGHVPFELIYDHPMPDSFDVPVCPSALAGAEECTKDCADRKRSDVVCPFGFWATSKVVERRLHTTNRRAAVVSDQRKVAVRQGAAVAVTPKADVDDHTASTRIGQAVSAFTAPGTCTITATWDELEQAVTNPCNLVVLVTHTIDPEDPEDDLTTQLELGQEAKFVRNIDKRYFNPTPNEPGPVVLALGCDTNEVQASYASLVQRLHSAGVEIVVSAISQIPGKEVADFVQRLTEVLAVLLADANGDPKRFGAVMTATRRTTLLRGDVLALALTASGDGDVQLIGG